VLEFNLSGHLPFGLSIRPAEPDQFQSFCGEATFFAKSDPALATPDLQAFVAIFGDSLCHPNHFLRPMPIDLSHVEMIHSPVRHFSFRSLT